SVLRAALDRDAGQRVQAFNRRPSPRCDQPRPSRLPLVSSISLPPHPARPTVPLEAWRRNSSNTTVVDVQLSLYRPIFFDCDFSTRLRATLDGAFSSVVLCSVEYIAC